MRFATLPEWLAWQENLHFTEVDPGLDRIGQVWQRLGGTARLPFKVVTIAGTNGKGSSVALASAILRAAGYDTGTYTSPHLLEYNERICINGVPCSDQSICEAFERIDQARKNISLTYFEFATLAAADIFSRQQIDVAVLEVGMGGRLDAVNLFDADVALITPIGLDHIAWLGDTREKIGTEKAGIIRPAQPVVCSEQAPPITIIERAQQLNASLYIAGKAFSVTETDSGMNWHNDSYHWDALPRPALAGHYQIQNSAAVLQVISLLNQQGMSISREAVENGLKNVKLSGRFQVMAGPVTRIFDVTHNQQGAENLASLLNEQPCNGRTYAVLAMLGDKDAGAVVHPLNNIIDRWFVAGLDGNRGMSGQQLADKLAKELRPEQLHIAESVEQAYQAAMHQANSGDRVLVFGSFHTVEAVFRVLPEFNATAAIASSG